MLLTKPLSCAALVMFSFCLKGKVMSCPAYHRAAGGVTFPYMLCDSGVPVTGVVLDTRAIWLFLYGQCNRSLRHGGLNLEQKSTQSQQRRIKDFRPLILPWISSRLKPQSSCKMLDLWATQLICEFKTSIVTFLWIWWYHLFSKQATLFIEALINIHLMKMRLLHSCHGFVPVSKWCNIGGFTGQIWTWTACQFIFWMLWHKKPIIKS